MPDPVFDKEVADYAAIFGNTIPDSVRDRAGLAAWAASDQFATGFNTARGAYLSDLKARLDAAPPVTP